jgi:phage terminase small subunit
VLEPKEAWFAEEYLVDFDPIEAARRAGIAEPEKSGPRLLSRRKIQRAIALSRARRATRVQIHADYVINRWKVLVDADPRELTEMWMVACRYCWGIDHSLQMTDGEFRAARSAHQENMLEFSPQDRTDFDEQGGAGYSINRFPMRGPDFVEMAKAHGQIVEANSNHSCPECHGHGMATPIFHDTRSLSPGGRALYKGVRRLANGGFEVLMRDQEFAEVQLAKHLPDPNKYSSKSIEEMTDEELEADLEANGVEIEGQFTRVDGGAPVAIGREGIPAPVPGTIRPRMVAE